MTAAARGARAARTVECPGFVDLQVNGFAGVDFNDPAISDDDVTRACDAVWQTGVTRVLPTLITAPRDRFAICARRLAHHRHRGIAGLHLEGPYISPIDGFRGAHPREHVRDASIDDFARRQEAADGRIVLVTIAPEVPGAIALIEQLTHHGIRVAIGHTNATGADVQAAISAGATLSTHLGNGCAQLLPRHPNVIWEQLAADALQASFIVDGHHLPPATVKVMLRAKTLARSILVTDAIAAAGRPPGRYRLGDLDVELSADGRVAAPGATNLAGSALSMDRAIANAARFTSLDLNEILPMATTTPARLIGIEPRGRVRAEWDADAGTLRVISVA
jgi:N-acetylglucosamine-6-phosphate deacetylase